MIGFGIMDEKRICIKEYHESLYGKTYEELAEISKTITEKNGKAGFVIQTTSKFKGYRVIAVDGLKGELPDTPELRNKYKLSKSNRYPQFYAVATFDMLNCIVISHFSTTFFANNMHFNALINKIVEFIKDFK